MRRITKPEAAAMRASLSAWHDPLAFHDALEMYRARYGLYAAGQGAMQPWREAWVGLQFADRLKAQSIRLGDDPPDFLLSIDGRVRAFELAEVHPRNRKMGAEYAEEAAQLELGVKRDVEAFDIEAELASVMDLLPKIAAAKAAKPYPSDTIFALFVNAMVLDCDEDAFDAATRTAASAALVRFAEVMILNQDRLLRFKS